MKRTPLKKVGKLEASNGLRKGKGLKKVSKSYSEGANERLEYGKKMMELFDRHWNTHPDRECESCGLQLWGENNTMYHDHSLPKSIYKHLAFEIDNLILVCPLCHANRHNGILNDKYQKEMDKIKEKLNV